MARKLVIIIPAYNESESIQETISALLKIDDNVRALGYECYIYVINDGSLDDTAALAQKAGASRVVHHKINLGLGAAVRTGLVASRSDGADIVVKFDGDLQHDPKDIVSLIKPIIDDEADIVYGNRFDKIDYRMPFVRKVGNMVFTGLIRWLTNWPLRDSQPGIFAVSRTYLKQFYLPGDYNCTQQILVDGFHKGMRFQQVPVNFTERYSGESFISLKYPFKVLPQIVQVLIGVKPLKIFAPIGLSFLAIGTITFVINIIEWLIGSESKPVQNVNLVLGCALFGLQTFFFGLLADLVVKTHRGKWD